MPLPDHTDEAAHGSRSFLLRVAGGLVVLLAVISVLSVRSSGGTGTSTTTVAPSTTSPIGVADLAPSTSVGANPAGGADSGGAGVAAVVTLPRSAMPVEGLRTPQAAARNLWDAWRDRDRPRALQYASTAAVDKLFDWTWAPQLRQAGCTPLEKSWLCRFEDPKHRWDLTVSGNTDEGYRVSAVRVGDPAGELLAPGELPSVTNTLPLITNPDGSPASVGPPLPSALTLPSTLPADSTLPSADAPTDGTGSSTKPSTDPSTNPPIKPSTDAGSAPVTRRQRSATTSRAKRQTSAPDTASAPVSTPVSSKRSRKSIPDTAAPSPDPAPAPKKTDPPAEPTGPVPVQGGSTPVVVDP